jgi:hypothetical protein
MSNTDEPREDGVLPPEAEPGDPDAAVAEDVALLEDLDAEGRRAVGRRFRDDFPTDEFDDEDLQRRRRRAPRRLWDDDLNDRLLDEAAGLSRALTVGYLSQIRMFADIAGTFATTVMDGALREQRVDGRRNGAERRAGEPARATSRSRDGRGRRWDEDAVDVAEDFVNGFLDAMTDAMDIPRRVVDDFYEAYDHDPERRPRRSRARR